MKIVTIVGARPQFIKAAAMSRKLRRVHEEVLVHTGQHYDYAMSGVFFDKLELPAPDFNLGIGSGSHGAQTGRMLEGLEGIMMREKPDWVLIYGDTNSTLAGALAASKLHIPVAHVEAGLRSFNRRMPEEMNRIVADHLSSLLLCPSAAAVENLRAEGVQRNVFLVGDIMLDILQWVQQRLDGEASAWLEEMGVQDRRYLLVTVHRSENTDSPDRFAAIVEALNATAEPVLFPAHPRARKMLAASGTSLAPHIRLIPPVDYVLMTVLTRSARLVLTDSGGLQKEAYWLQTPCVTLRDETEWTETVGSGWNRLAGADTSRILDAVRSFTPPSVHPALYGNGGVAERCLEIISQQRPLGGEPTTKGSVCRNV